MRSETGASLVELAMVVAIMGVLAAIAIPRGLQMQQNAVYRQEAMAIGAMLREARSRTVSFNLENRVELDLTAGANRYRLVQGNASAGSTVWATVVRNWVNAPQTVALAQAGCTGMAPPIFTVDFNPNGSAGVGCAITVLDVGGTVRRTITITQNTGRVRIS
ncbi:MAG: pilus assembly FimT family protein [Nitrospirota bacterium]